MISTSGHLIPKFPEVRFHRTRIFTVLLALGNIKGEVVERPKALGDIRGVTYIYGMFYRFGLINVPDKVKEKMGRPINRKN